MKVQRRRNSHGTWLQNTGIQMLILTIRNILSVSICLLNTMVKYQIVAISIYQQPPSGVNGMHPVKYLTVLLTKGSSVFMVHWILMKVESPTVQI